MAYSSNWGMNRAGAVNNGSEDVHGIHRCASRGQKFLERRPLEGRGGRNEQFNQKETRYKAEK